MSSRIMIRNPCRTTTDYGRGRPQLWVELLNDQNVGASGLVVLERLSQRSGYRWEVFDFRRKSLKFIPGRYWIAMGFMGNQIVDRIYTCDKPVER
ncbi:MAG: hypothetical protein V1766_01070 [Pseudomonadota bacterium]